MASTLVWLMALSLAAKPADKAKPKFEYDTADETVRTTMVGDENAYEPHVVALKDRLWITWLEFEPGKGDRIWVGCRAIKGGEWLSRKAIKPEPGSYRNPTLTPDKAGVLWLSYEQQDGETWSVNATQLRIEGNAAAAMHTTQAGESVVTFKGPGINHRTAADPKDGIWLTRQNADTILINHCTSTSNVQIDVASFPNGHVWQPDIAVLPDGEVCVTFDASEGKSSGFDTYVVRRNEGQCSPIRILGGTDAFEARARVISGADGRVWTLWEEGNRNWGKPYRSLMRKFTPDQLEMTDTCGPLHSFRWLHVNELVGAGRSPVDPPLPMPTLDTLAKRPNAPKGVEYLGGYYEGGELAVDGLGRLWVAYRHHIAPWIGMQKHSHVQQDLGVFARCYDGKSWSKLFRCDAGQGDGMQRLSVTGLSDGIAMVYSKGRTDRRPSDSPVNIALATIHLPGEAVQHEPSGTAAELPTTQPAKAEAVDKTKVGGYRLFYGDVHRHTDLSLCAMTIDGTMEDAYRYAIDAAKLDFLGVTDHSRDIVMGKEKSLLWWRCRKEVSRHTLAPQSTGVEPQFIGMYAYEHSRGGEDHNVISLRPDLLLPDTIPFPQLWAKMDGDTFTIPHQTVCNPIPPSGVMPLGLDGKTWGYRDDAHRPLLEIYQGCRDRAIEGDAHLGLSKGHIFGFIASSDHMSTASSYAGVWAEKRAEKRGRESIFRAMQARRTFGATAKINLRMMMGKHWMGEQVTVGEVGPIHVVADGTAVIQGVDLIVDGRVSRTLAQDKQRIELDLTLPAFASDQATSDGIHYFYVRVRQADGNLAWSSPIWVRN